MANPFDGEGSTVGVVGSGVSVLRSLPPSSAKRNVRPDAAADTGIGLFFIRVRQYRPLDALRNEKGTREVQRVGVGGKGPGAGEQLAAAAAAPS